LEIELSEEGIKYREESLEKLREELNKLIGVMVNIGGFISHHMDEVLSGVRSAIAMRIFVTDLAQRLIITQQVNDVMKRVEGIIHL
jgi:Cu/Ag efflux pump CusA